MRILLVLALVACNAPRGPQYRGAGNGSPRAGGTLHIATKDPVRTLDPTIEYDEVSNIAVHMLFETLVGYDPHSMAIEPRLAERWEVSPDGLVYRFSLREGVVYSDGTPIVAGDVAYSLERAQTTEDSPFGSMLGDVAKDGITAPDARTLEVRLARPNAAFVYVMTMPFTTPQRRDHVARAGEQIRRDVLGSGPFVLAAWREGERIELRKNARYWNAAKVYLDGIDWLENIPTDTQFMMFERGELDTVDRPSAPDYLWIAGQAAWKPSIRHVANMNVYGSRMNVRRKPFDDRRVRQALNYAFNKAHVVKLLYGDAVPAHGMLPPGMSGRDDALPPYPHDPAKARALLAEAGYAHGLDVDYVTINDELASRLAASLQADLAEVGVRMRIEVMSLASFGTAYGKPDGPAFSYDGWVGDFPDPVNFIDAKFHSSAIAEENSPNESFYANPELDALLDRARAEVDPARRAELYTRAERILYDDAPWIWGYHQMVSEVVQPYVMDYAPHPVWNRDYSTTWLDLDAQGRRVAR
ncbi:MAG: ABC transporter substrate-binding protein [Kofleriaceae bacterium]|nr:ABC transporter substrate-binding protein [Kofleriaceae bacterium]